MEGEQEALQDAASLEAVLETVPPLEALLKALPAIDYMYFSLACLTVFFLWDMYLDWRQTQVVITTTEPPADILALMDADTYSKARLYSMDKANFSFWHGLFDQAHVTVFILLGFFPLIWSVSGDLMRMTPYSNELLQSNIFLLVNSVISTIIDTPFSVYRIFVIEEKHGFNKMAMGFYFKDKAKKFVLSQAITSVVMTCLVFLIQWGGDYFFIYSWAFTFAFTLFFFFIYADFIAPLFDKYTPLPASPLKTAIEELASSINFPLTKLYVVDGSKRSNHSNAYFYGFYKNKRIVLFDTLLNDDCNPLLGLEEPKKEFPSEEVEEEKKKKKTGCTQDEVIAVLGHEMGHWYHNHVFKPMLLNQFIILGMFYTFGQLIKNPQLLSDFGFTAEQPTLIALIVIFQFILSPWNKAMASFSTYITRCFEFQADRFAVSLGYGQNLQSSLAKLCTDNLSFPISDHLYSAFNHSHPPILERLAAIRAEMSKTKGEDKKE